MTPRCGDDDRRRSHGDELTFQRSADLLAPRGTDNDRMDTFTTGRADGDDGGPGSDIPWTRSFVVFGGLVYRFVGFES